MMCLRDNPFPFGPGKGGEEYLARDDQSLAGNPGHGFSHHGFRQAVRIHIGIIEEINALVVGSMEQVDGRLLSNWEPNVTHAPREISDTFRPERPRRR